jgi:hypothetical protein
MNKDEYLDIINKAKKDIDNLRGLLWCIQKRRGTIKFRSKN